MVPGLPGRDFGGTGNDGAVDEAQSGTYEPPALPSMEATPTVFGRSKSLVLLQALDGGFSLRPDQVPELGAECTAPLGILGECSVEWEQ